jgi:hypothetical protein
MQRTRLNMCRCFFLVVLCLTHSLIPPRKKWLLSAGFECAKGWCMLWKWKCIFDCSITTNHKTSLLWQSTHVGRTSSVAWHCVLRRPTLLKNIFNTWPKHRRSYFPPTSLASAVNQRPLFADLRRGFWCFLSDFTIQNWVVMLHEFLWRSSS